MVMAPSKQLSLPRPWLYVLALLPLPFLFLSAIPSPPPDHGSGSMFDLIATRYDFINRALSLNLDMGWRHRLVREVVGDHGELFAQRGDGDEAVRLLDLATGTADVAILLGQAATRYSKSPGSTTPAVSVVGLDPSQNMLNVGVDKVRAAGLSDVVSLRLGDARALSSIDDDSVDAVSMSFGIRNVPEKDAALCEIHRALKKGTTRPSRLAIMEFSEPGDDAGVVGALARLFIRHVVPAAGALLSGRPREYLHLQTSIRDFPPPAQFVALMEGLKCPVRNGDGHERAVDRFGAFRVQEVVNLNFGSVQIYLATPVLKKYVTE